MSLLCLVDRCKEPLYLGSPVPLTSELESTSGGLELEASALGRARFQAGSRGDVPHAVEWPDVLTRNDEERRKMDDLSLDSLGS